MDARQKYRGLTPKGRWWIEEISVRSNRYGYIEVIGIVIPKMDCHIGREIVVLIKIQQRNYRLCLRPDVCRDSQHNKKCGRYLSTYRG